MAKKGENGEPVGLECAVCGHKLRHTEKNKKNTVEKLLVKKHCPNCKKHTEHKEKKNG